MWRINKCITFRLFSWFSETVEEALLMYIEHGKRKALVDCMYVLVCDWFSFLSLRRSEMFYCMCRSPVVMWLVVECPFTTRTHFSYCFSATHKARRLLLHCQKPWTSCRPFFLSASRGTWRYYRAWCLNNGCSGFFAVIALVVLATHQEVIQLINHISFLISLAPVCCKQIRGASGQRLVRVFTVCDVEQLGL